MIRKEVGQRLMRESSRLELSQDDIARLAQCSRRTWCNYVAGTSCPDAEMLNRLDRLGFDVLYVVTGRTG